MVKQQRHPCPCCAFLTLPEEAPGTFHICEVCWWEDDNLQFHDLARLGANSVSLAEARRAFESLGAITREAVTRVRPPRPEEIPPA